jgi:hypothetical protein
MYGETLEPRLDSPPRRPQIPEIQQVVLLPEGEEVGEEGVPVGLEREMEDEGEVGVVDVGKHAQELLVDVLGSGGEGGRVLSTYRRPEMGVRDTMRD